VLRFGSKGHWVGRLELLLESANQTLNLSVLSVNTGGLFNRDMVKAVEAFQNAAGLIPNGVVGASTWKKLWLW
jgi:murein L,D-transpeptidase YcbB/YkuD